MKNKKFALTTPVLYLVFNRLDTIKQTFPEIKKAKPKQLFIAADGPRTKEEEKKTDSVREYVISNIDWPCKVKKLFRRKNLGCKYAVSGAIDWFFNNVTEGIILEDDCLPDQSFFRFCQEMLEKYKDDERIMHISGTNVERESSIPESYFFSNTFNVWGWATWRRAWKYYDVEMREWPKHNSLKCMRNLGYLGYLSLLRAWRILNLTYKGKIDTWDYQWSFCCRINKGLSIISQKNTITNIGFEEGTHTAKDKENKKKMIERYDLMFPLEENNFLVVNEYYNKRFRMFFGRGKIKSILKRIFN